MTPGRHRLFIDKLIAAFSPPFFERVRGFGIETERPVFIVGLPRSGTTLTEQILASHPRVLRGGRADAGPADVRIAARRERSTAACRLIFCRLSTASAFSTWPIGT